MSVSLTVLIPTHGRPRLLERTLESVARCTLPDGYEELVVIENGSRAGTERLVDGLPKDLNARYMHRERPNKSYALNQALETIADGLVVFFDDDVQVHRDTLVAYAEAGRKHGRGHFFGGPVQVDREKDLPTYLEDFFPRSARGYDLVETRMGQFYLGFNWAAFSRDIKDFGGFDPRFGPGSPAGSTGQETDMQERLIDGGWRGVDVPGAIVQHHVPQENVSLAWLLGRQIKDGVRKGLETKTSVGRFVFIMIWRTLVSLGVLAKGTITVDQKKLVFVLCNFFKRIGVIKGYAWKSLSYDSYF